LNVGSNRYVVDAEKSDFNAVAESISKSYITCR